MKKKSIKSSQKASRRALKAKKRVVKKGPTAAKPLGKIQHQTFDVNLGESNE